MNWQIIFQNALEYGMLGSLCFFVVLVVVSRTKIFEAVRDEEGNFRKGMSLKGLFGMGMMLALFVSIFWFSSVELAEKYIEPSFLVIWLNAFIVFFIIHLFDLIVIDWLLIIVWHPKFLNLPDTDYYTKLKPHIEGFFRGIPLGVTLTLVVSAIYYYL